MERWTCREGTAAKRRVDHSDNSKRDREHSLLIDCGKKAADLKVNYPFKTHFSQSVYFHAQGGNSALTQLGDAAHTGGEQRLFQRA